MHSLRRRTPVFRRYGLLFLACLSGFRHGGTYMKEWTEQEVLEKLRKGWRLHGDIAKDKPFGLIDPTAQTIDSFPMISASIVQGLFDKGRLDPSPIPGKSFYYRLSTSH